MIEPAKLCIPNQVILVMTLVELTELVVDEEGCVYVFIEDELYLAHIQALTAGSVVDGVLD